MGSPVTIQTRFGTLSVGLRTNHTTRGKHSHVGTGRNIPGISAFAGYTKQRDFMSHVNVEVTGPYNMQL